MDEQKNSRRTHILGSEPGRRYVAGRVRPRAGADVRPSTRQVVPQKPLSTPATHQTAFAKHLDSVSGQSTNPKKHRATSKAKPALPRTARSSVLKRQMVEHAKYERTKVRKKHRRHLIACIIASAVIAAALLVFWSFQGLLPFNIRFFDEGQNQPQPTDTKQVQEASSLDETAVSKNDIISYMMADDAPRVVRIPKLDVEARILRVGVSLKGEPIAPTNIFDVGWFESSGKPGVPGAVLLNGHTSGPTKNGLFSALRELVPGDQIIVERGDGTALTYKVSKIQEYTTNQVDMGAAVESIDPTKQGLNLMTTANSYNNQSDQAEKRIIVFAVM